MPRNLGPGPVFVYESITAARRWQPYAVRSLFVLAVLAALAMVWSEMAGKANQANIPVSLRSLASLGENFYYTIGTVQLIVILLAAPAATAGSVCVDRERGTLSHVLVTDLSNTEVVVGKLFARLAPVASLVLAAVPVMAIATLLGGIVPSAIATLTAVSLAVAVFACSLALAFSARASSGSWGR
jgi:ABC-type transport system involved in multi-copper enzyme maturation permease subunit